MCAIMLLIFGWNPYLPQFIWLILEMEQSVSKSHGERVRIVYLLLKLTTPRGRNTYLQFGVVPELGRGFTQIKAVNTFLPTPFVSVVPVLLVLVIFCSLDIPFIRLALCFGYFNVSFVLPLFFISVYLFVLRESCVCDCGFPRYLLIWFSNCNIDITQNPSFYQHKSSINS